jgi:hypothetical protein
MLRMDENTPLPNPTDVAAKLAPLLAARGLDYAFGGALALGYWAEPRGTMDVDVTLFLPADRVDHCLQVLRELGCQIADAEAAKLLHEHGFCRVHFAGVRLDVFLPTIPFYEAAKERRRSVPLRQTQIMIWDAETLCVFKMMFFRDKDLVDLRKIVSQQGATFDRQWVRAQLVEIYGQRDTRILRLDELFGESMPR